MITIWVEDSLRRTATPRARSKLQVHYPGARGSARSNFTVVPLEVKSMIISSGEWGTVHTFTLKYIGVFLLQEVDALVELGLYFAGFGTLFLNARLFTAWHPLFSLKTSCDMTREPIGHRRRVLSLELPREVHYWYMRRSAISCRGLRKRLEILDMLSYVPHTVDNRV